MTATQFIWFQLWEFVIGSTTNPIIDISPYSHHLSAWYCMNIVWTSSVLVTHGSWRVNKMVIILQVLFIYHNKFFCPKRGKLRSRQKSILQVYLRKSSSTLKSFILLFSLFRTSICLPNYFFKNCAVYSSSLVQYCSFQSMVKFCSE